MSSTQMTIRDHLQSDQLKAVVAEALPQGTEEERQQLATRTARLAINALTKTPKLAKCSQASFFKCLLDMAQWGLDADGRHAHLIPYGQTCELIIDYKGYVKLAYNTGKVKSIRAGVIYEGDLYRINNNKLEEHVSWEWRNDAGKPDERGIRKGAYAIIELAGGAEHHELMTATDVESIRSRSKAKDSGPWKTDTDEMYKKTAFRRAAKWIPLSAEVHEAFDRDFDRFPQIVDAVPVAKTGATSVKQRVLEVFDEAVPVTTEDEGDDEV